MLIQSTLPPVQLVEELCWNERWIRQHVSDFSAWHIRTSATSPDAPAGATSHRTRSPFAGRLLWGTLETRTIEPSSRCTLVKTPC